MTTVEKFDIKQYYLDNRDKIIQRSLKRYRKSREGIIKKYQVTYNIQGAPKHKTGYIYKSISDISRRTNMKYSRIRSVFKNEKNDLFTVQLKTI